MGGILPVHWWHWEIMPYLQAKDKNNHDFVF